MASRVLPFFAAVFLLLNLAVRLFSLYTNGVVFNVLVPVAAVISLLVWIRPGSLKLFCLLLGLSLPLYGFQSYTLYNHVFEFWLVLLGCLLVFCRSSNVKNSRQSGMVVWLLVAYTFLALLSLQLLPVASFVDSLSLWGVFDFASAVFAATPENPWYSLAAVNRLMLFGLVILLLSRDAEAEVLYRRFFTGCACSVLAACFLGIANQAGILSLTWYRPEFLDGSGADRLHSVFGNPGWAAEYILLCTPLVLLLPGWKFRLKKQLLILTALLAVVGISLLLTGSRTSWLLFPGAMYFCYVALLALHGTAKGEAVSWRRIRHSCIKVGLGGLLLLLVAGSGLWLVDRFASFDSDDGSLSRTEYILQRISNITVPRERGKVWPESLAMVSESPVYGLGYETYRWHHGIMSSIPDSRLSLQRRTTVSWDTAHNFYIQLAVSNGIVGLILWLGLAGYVGFVLLQDALKGRNMQSAVLLGSLGLFHLYGLTQSMPYVGSIWFLLFMFVGYAMLAERRVCLSVPAWLGKFGVAAVLLAVAGGGVVYAENPQSRQLAGRYMLPRYVQHYEGEIYKGFYWRENWGKDGFFRWSGRRAEIVLSGSGSVQIDFACYAPRLDSSPLTFTVRLNKHPVDEYTFREAGKVTRTYSLSKKDIRLPAVLELEVSRTWIPKREHMGNDTRVLGVAVSEPKYLEKHIAGDVK